MGIIIKLIPNHEKAYLEREKVHLEINKSNLPAEISGLHLKKDVCLHIII